MKPFSITSRLTDSVAVFEVSGYVDEHAAFPSASNRPFVRISLKEVMGINSIGTKLWCNWMRQMGTAKIELSSCPFIFVKCFNQIKGSLTDNTVVLSFYVPFVSEDLGQRKDVLLVRHLDFDSTGLLKTPKATDDAGQPMELDVMPEFCQFVKR